MWQREFGSDPAIAGKTLTLRGLPYTIAGVAPAVVHRRRAAADAGTVAADAARRGGRARGHQRLGAVADRQDAARAARLPMDVRQGTVQARRHRRTGARQRRVDRRGSSKRRTCRPTRIARSRRCRRGRRGQPGDDLHRPRRGPGGELQVQGAQRGHHLRVVARRHQGGRADRRQQCGLTTPP